MLFLLLLIQDTSQLSSNYTNVILNGIFVLLAVIITMGINWLINYRSFKYEYYKKIIEKRIEVYELVEIILNKTRPYGYYKNKNIQMHIFRNWETYKLFRDELMTIGENSYWLSVRIENKLDELNTYLLSNVPADNRKKVNWLQIGIDNYETMAMYSAQIEFMFIKDLKKLHKVARFLRDRSPNTLTELLYKIKLKK